MFGASAPNFNISGSEKYSTVLGGFFSAVVLMLTIMFAGLKLQHLIEHKNPSITTNTRALEIGEKYDLASDDFKIAFSAATVAFEPKSDPRYMRWVARFRTVDKSIDTEEEIPLHLTGLHWPRPQIAMKNSHKPWMEDCASLH